MSNEPTVKPSYPDPHLPDPQRVNPTREPMRPPNNDPLPPVNSRGRRLRNHAGREEVMSLRPLALSAALLIGGLSADTNAKSSGFGFAHLHD